MHAVASVSSFVAERVRRNLAWRVGLTLWVMVGASMSVGGAAQAAIINFAATIDQAQETPPTGSASVWTGSFQLDTATSMVSYTITNTGPPLGSPEIAAHVHKGAPGVPGPIEFPLPLGSPKMGSYGPLSAGQLNDMLAGLHYVNIHTTGFVGGEVRGQMLSTGPLPLDHFKCYKIKKDTGTFPATANLSDQFQSGSVEIKKQFLWCNPVSKNGGLIFNGTDHLFCYKIKGTTLSPFPKLQSTNQFGVNTLFAKKPFLLCVPGTKTILAP